MRAMAIVLMLPMLAPSTAVAQMAQADVWRVFAQRIEVGSRVRVRLDDGRRVAATLIDAGDDGLLVQPKTRVPVLAQRIGYDRITSIERDKARGMSAGKAVVIGVVSGVGAVLGMFLILIATID
jgi:hypothetical protein